MSPHTSPPVILPEASIDELIAELETRAMHVVVLMDAPTGNPELCRRSRKTGDVFAAIGLCEWASHQWKGGVAVQGEPT